MYKQDLHWLTYNGWYAINPIQPPTKKKATKKERKKINTKNQKNNQKPNFFLFYLVVIKTEVPWTFLQKRLL